jgi:hypothetical protein
MSRKIEHIAMFMASRPKERRRLSTLGALRLNREEARNIIRKRTKAFSFFATVSTKIDTFSENTEVTSLSIQMIDQEEEPRPTTFELFLELDNVYIAKIYDVWLKDIKSRTYPENSLKHLPEITKANIILSILGLGLIYRQHRHQELEDLPEMVNYLETLLRKKSESNIAHKLRGQRPTQHWTDTENMAFTDKT